MQKHFSKSKIRSKVHEEVRKLQKKYEPRHASSRHLFSIVNPKTAVNELIYLNRYCQVKKVIVPSSKSTLLFQADSPPFPKPSSIPCVKHKKQRFSPSPSKLLFSTELDLTPHNSTYNSKSRLEKLIRMSDSPIMASYKNLMRTCSQVLPKKKKIFEEEEKQAKRISKRINYIFQDLEDDNKYVSFREKVEVRKSRKKYTKLYLSEALRDMRDIRYIP